VYAYLLQKSPATGYRVAAGIGKPAANTYKAIESLAAKGALELDEGQNTLCRAVPPNELLGRLERAFAERQKRALKSLSELPGAASDDRVYQMRSPEQVFERCRQMLGRAQEIVFADLFPDTLAELRPDLEAAAARISRVAVKAYRPAECTGVEIHADPDGEITLKRWPGQWVNMVVDGAEYVQAFLTADGKQVHQAVWSGSAYLSWVYHSALGSEFGLAGLGQMLAAGAGTDELRTWLETHIERTAREAPGYRALQARFGHGTQV
jgi:hypothetical protein